MHSSFLCFDQYCAWESVYYPLKQQIEYENVANPTSKFYINVKTITCCKFCQQFYFISVVSLQHEYKLNVTFKKHNLLKLIFYWLYANRAIFRY